MLCSNYLDPFGDKDGNQREDHKTGGTQSTLGPELVGREVARSVGVFEHALRTLADVVALELQAPLAVQSTLAVPPTLFVTLGVVTVRDALHQVFGDSTRHVALRIGLKTFRNLRNVLEFSMSFTTKY